MKKTKNIVVILFVALFIAIIPTFSNAAKIKVDKVKGTKVSSNKVTSISLKWKSVKKATGYKIYIYNAKKKKYEYKAQTQKNYYEIKKLKSAETYKIKVRAYRTVKNTKYYGAYSNVLTTTTKPSITKKLKVKEVTANSVSLVWNKVARATSYKVYMYNSETKKFEEKVTTNKNNAIVEGLTQLEEYKFKVRAVKRLNKKNYFGEYSNIVITDTKLLKATGLRTNSATLDSITLDWDYNAKALGYKIYMYDSTSKSYIHLGDTAEHTYTINDLKYATGYKFKVLSYGEYKGNTVYSYYSDIFETATYPKSIENINTGKITTSSIELKWNKVDNVTGYAVYIYSESAQGFKLYQTTTKNYINVTDLKAAKFYKFYVKTYITLNNKQYYGKASETISKKTLSTEYSKAGIDVSKHQGIIDWDSVKEMGVDFAILRLGWIGNKGNHTLDGQFERNYSECKRLNIPIGVYVYCYSKSTTAAKDGANWATEKLNEKSLELPVFIDMEDSSIVNVGKKELSKICIAFNEIISKAGFIPGIYANRNWFDNYLNEDLRTKYTCWIAHYTSSNKINYEDSYPIWQYSSAGKVNGVSGNVDLNIMYIKE